MNRTLSQPTCGLPTCLPRLLAPSFIHSFTTAVRGHTGGTYNDLPLFKLRSSCLLSGVALSDVGQQARAHTSVARKKRADGDRDKRQGSHIVAIAAIASAHRAPSSPFLACYVQATFSPTRTRPNLTWPVCARLFHHTIGVSPAIDSPKGL